MTITFDVLIKDTEEEYEEIRVEFEGEPTWEDDSYSDEFGLVKRTRYANIGENGSPIWDKTKYTPEQNKLIEDWYYANDEYVDDKFCEKLEDETNNNINHDC